MAYVLDFAAARPATLHPPTPQRKLAPAGDMRTWRQIHRALCTFEPHIVHTDMAKAGALGRLAAIAVQPHDGVDGLLANVHAMYENCSLST
jgi:hypothetical protein